MPQATLTSKGQITVPKAVRDILRLSVGQKVEFLVTGNEEVLLRPLTKTVDDVFGRLYKPGRPPRSLGDMDEGIRRKIRSDKP